MTAGVPTHFESDWGRYRVHRADGDRLVLEDLANPGAYVTPTAEQLAASYRPFTPKTPRPKRPRDVASGSGPVAQIAPSPSGSAAASGGVSADGGGPTSSGPVRVEDDAPVSHAAPTPTIAADGAAPRSEPWTADWSPPRSAVDLSLVLGAIPPRGTHFNPTVPAEPDAPIVNALAPALAPYWIPCFTRSVVEPGEPHAYFIFDGTSLKCEMCRPPAPPRRAYDVPPPMTDEERVSVAHAFWRLAQMRGGRTNIAPPRPPPPLPPTRPTPTPVAQPAPVPAKPKQSYPPCNGCRQIKIIMILMRPMRQGEPWWSLCSRCYRGASLEVQAHAI